MAGLGGLAALSNAPAAYQQGRYNIDASDLADYKVDDAKRSALGRVAMGNALQLLAGGGGGSAPGGMPQPPGGGPQPPPPGQPSQPMMQPGMGSPQGGISPDGVLRQSGGMPPAPPQGGMPPFGQRFQGTPMAPPQAGPPGGGMPPQPMGPMGGMQQPPGGQGQGQQPMDWRQIVAAVKQANPSITPDVMAEAVNQFAPFMTAASRQEWQQVRLQLQEENLRVRENAVMMRGGVNPYRDQQGGGQGGQGGYTPGDFQGGDEETPGRPRNDPGGRGVENLPRDVKPGALAAFAQGRPLPQAEHPFGKSKDGLATEFWAYELYPSEHDGKYPTPREIYDQMQNQKPKSATQLKQERNTIVGSSIKKQLDSALSDVINSTRGGTNVVGVIGNLNRMLETGLQILGASDEDAAKAFQTKLSFLRPQLVRYLTGTARISNKEIDEMSNALRGLSVGSTKVSTIQSLKYAKQLIDTYAPELLEQDKSSAQTPRGGAPAPQQGGAPQQGTPQPAAKPDPTDPGFREFLKSKGMTDQQIDEALGAQNQQGQGGGELGSYRKPGQGTVEQELEYRRRENPRATEDQPYEDITPEESARQGRRNPTRELGAEGARGFNNYKFQGTRETGPTVRDRKFIEVQPTDANMDEFVQRFGWRALGIRNPFTHFRGSAGMGETIDTLDDFGKREGSKRKGSPQSGRPF